MISLQDIDVALDRAEVLASVDISPEAQQELLTCLSNARGMLRELGREASDTLTRMNDTLDSLRDISQAR
jgi:hypothetical protein